MDSTASLALSIFGSVRILVELQNSPNRLYALTGSMLMIICGILTQETAIHHIDFNTIGLLAGMMVVVFHR